MSLLRLPSGATLACVRISFGGSYTLSHGCECEGLLQSCTSSRSRLMKMGRGIDCKLTVPVLCARSTRPTLDDVERLSRGRASKAKIGSRAVPHRLNADERKAFELAKKRGFVVHQPNTRRYPLINSHRNYCDALGIPCIRIDQGIAGQRDEVVMDLTSLRLSEVGLQSFTDAVVEAVASIMSSDGAAINPSMGDAIHPTSDLEDSSSPCTVQSDEEQEEEKGTLYSTDVDSLNAMLIVQTSEESKLLRFEASSRSQARLMAQTGVETWKNWSAGHLKVAA
ncbi:hypothetical protein Mapa_004224 [Marchantia paleacea]|nr:hypothetical protein Mapa_004224 [Marchantia paleacea]